MAEAHALGIRVSRDLNPVECCSSVASAADASVKFSTSVSPRSRALATRASDLQTYFGRRSYAPRSSFCRAAAAAAATCGRSASAVQLLTGAHSSW